MPQETRNDKSMTGKDALDFVRANAPNDEALDALFTMDKDMVKAMDEALKAKDAAFQKEDDNFWKPEKAGDKLKGIYLGSAKSGRLLVHAIGTKDSKGKPLAVRVNGTAVLTRKLKRGAIGQGVIIEYLGEVGTAEEGRNPLRKFETHWLNN